MPMPMAMYCQWPSLCESGDHVATQRGGAYLIPAPDDPSSPEEDEVGDRRKHRPRNADAEPPSEGGRRQWIAQTYMIMTLEQVGRSNPWKKTMVAEMTAARPT
jgi:hypothetical protein